MPLPSRYAYGIPGPHSVRELYQLTQLGALLLRQDSSGRGFDAKPINSPVFNGNFMDLNASQKAYVELPQSLVQALQSWPSFSFTGWVNFKTVRVIPRRPPGTAVQAVGMISSI